MKKLLLFLFVFMGLSSMAQENNILDQYKGLPLQKHRGDLYFGESFKAPNTHLLTDNELKTMMDTELFDQFNSGRTLYYTGNTLKTVGWIAFGIGLGYAGLTYFVYDYNLTKDALLNINLGLLNAGLGVDMFVVGYILRGIGNGKLDGVVEQYNQNTQKVSFHVSPSLMRCCLLQDQSHTTLGLTFSVDF